MSDRRRQRLLLGILAVLAVVVAVIRLGPLLLDGDDGPRGPRLDADGFAGVEVTELEVGRLAAEARDYKPGRDPFSYYDPPPKPPPGPTAEELAALEAARRAREEQPPPPPPVDPGPQPPEIELVYLGSFGPDERPIAVLSDGDDIYNVLVGDVLDGQFIVTNIGLESVDLAYVEFPQLPPARLAVGG